MTPRRPLHKRRQFGISLVELMVAMTLGLIISAVVFTVFMSSRQGYRAQDGTSLMQDNARFALETLSRAIREAGFFGGADPLSLVWFPAELDNPAANACSDPWIADARMPLRGYSGDAAPPLPSPCVPNGYQANTDVLVVRSANPNTNNSTGYIPAADIPANANLMFFRAIPRGRGVIFRGSEAASADSAVAGQDEETGVFSWRYEPQVFSVAMPPEPMMGAALYAFTQGNPVSQPMVDGVEMLRFAYGLDTDNDRSVDTWVRADQIDDDTLWNRVLAVRIGIVVRGNELDGFVDDREYTLPGGITYEPPAEVRGFPRRVYTHDVQIRNRTRN